jgi:hypothetical protein
MAEKITAVLIRGNSYSLRNEDGTFTHFHRGERVKVTPAQKARLEVEAIDLVTQRDDDDRVFNQPRAKFNFPH